MKNDAVLFCLIFIAAGLSAKESTAFDRFPIAIGLFFNGTVAGSGIQYVMPWEQGEISIAGAVHYESGGTNIHPLFTNKNSTWEYSVSYEYNLGVQFSVPLLSNDIFSWLSTRLYWLAGINHGAFDTTSSVFKPYVTFGGDSE